jgi:Predicted oxidoreductases (related to aryl-alcohol dehydrogenases)
LKGITMALFRNLGPFSTTAIGHGEMPLTIENNRGHEVGIETLHASLDAGCRHIDTAWAYYCSGGEEQTGEKLVREALETWKGPKDEVLVATKVGHFRNFTDGRPTWDVDGRPENLIRRGKESALALGVDTIDLLYFHRPDPKVPYNESVEAIKQLVDEGGAGGRYLQRLHRANRHCARHSGRQARGRAKPVLADSPGDPGHARLLRQGWLGLRVLEPARRLPSPL